jgi:hypothetical protein
MDTKLVEHVSIWTPTASYYHLLNSLNDRVVGSIDPSSPGINVSDLSRHLGVGEQSPDLTNIVDQSSRIRTRTRKVRDTSRRDTVKILRSHRDTRNQVGERRPVLRDRSTESSKLVVKVSLTSRRPQSEEEVCVCVDGSWDGRYDAVGGAGLDHGVETSGAELSVGVGESLGGGEQVGELLERDSRAVGVCGAVVKAIVGGGGDGREGDELAEDLHVVLLLWCFFV